jgi:hypothetical protein
MSQITKRAIEASLKNLLRKSRGQDHDCRHHRGLRRQPHDILLHFKDIYDLIEWSCVEDAARALEGKKTYDTWQQGFMQIFEAVLENKPFISSVYRSISREHVENYLYKLTYNLLIGVVNEKAVGVNVRDDDKHFIADFYKFGFVGLVLDWIKSDMKEDPRQIVNRLGTLTHGSISRALEAFRTDPH